jgi:transposase
MTCDPDHLPDDPNALKRLVVALLESDAAKQKTLDEMVAEIAKLNATVQKLTEMLFGKKSKKLANIAAAPETSASEEEAPTSSVEETPSGTSDASDTSVPPVPKSPRRKKPVNGGGGRMKLPDNLPVTIVEKYPPEHERSCTECETPFKVIGFEVARQVAYVPPRFEIIEMHNMKYIADCPCSACRSVTAEPDIAPIDKGIASVSLLAIMAVMKYADHLPLARQATRIFLRSGIQFSQSSMCRWARKVADLLEPLYDLMWELVLMTHCLQFDASFVKCRDENLKGKCRQTYVYGARGDETQPFDVFFFAKNGTRDKLMEFLKEFHNILQCDANSTYDQVFKPLRPVPGKLLPTEQGCWSHARSNFVDAMKSHATAATEMLDMIAALYAAEKQAKKYTPQQRLALRQTQSVAILNRIFEWCHEKLTKYTPKDLMHTAIAYLLNNETALRLYCTDGTLQIDNNACERMLRQLAVGRKNWLFFGNERGGKTACILYTLLSSAHRHGHNEFEYLCDIMTKLADLHSESELRVMLPDRWKPRPV